VKTEKNTGTIAFRFRQVLLYYNIIYHNTMGPLSYMLSVVDRNVVTRRMTVHVLGF